MTRPAAAQNFGPGPGPYADRPGSGPPPYYSDRPPQGGDRPPYVTEHPASRGPDPAFPPPPQRGVPPGPEQRYGEGGEERLDSRPPPHPRDREPPPVHRAEKAPPPRSVERRAERPPLREERATVSMAEFRDLESRVRELEMLLQRRDFREDRPPRERPPTIIYR